MLERALADLHSTLAREPAFDPASSERVFRLGADDYTQAMLLPPRLEHLERDAPSIGVSVVYAPNSFEPVNEGHVDLATMTGVQVPSPLQSRKLFTEGFTCMVRARHPKVKNKLTMSQYLSMRHLVVAPSGTRGSVVDTELAKRGKQRKVALRVSSFLVAPVLVFNSDLISTGPERLFRRFATIYPVRVLPPPLPLPRFTFSIVWHPRFASDAAHRWFRDIVAQILGDRAQ